MTEIKIAKKELSEDFRSEFVKSLQGKDFILYGGLVTLAHTNGFKGIRSEIVQFPNDDNGGVCIVHAVVIDAQGNEWHGIGDADDTNVNKTIAKHKIRMAETRAKGRALRDALGIDFVMDSELTDPYEKEMITQHQAKTIKKIMKDKGLDKDDLSGLSYELFGIRTSSKLLKEQADSLIAELEIFEFDDEDEEEIEKVLPAKGKQPVFDDEDEDDDEEDEE
jgi:hypothetical protein